MTGKIKNNAVGMTTGAGMGFMNEMEFRAGRMIEDNHRPKLTMIISKIMERMAKLIENRRFMNFSLAS